MNPSWRILHEIHAHQDCDELPRNEYRERLQGSKMPKLDLQSLDKLQIQLKLKNPPIKNSVDNQPHG